jgi:hypothetical protein
VIGFAGSYGLNRDAPRSKPASAAMSAASAFIASGSVELHLAVSSRSTSVTKPVIFSRAVWLPCPADETHDV